MAEREYGDGTISERLDGRWCGVLELPREDGKRKQKFVYGKTEKEVEQKLIKARALRDANLPQQNDKISVGTYLDDWLLNTAKRSVRETTWNSYEQHIRLYLKPKLGRYLLVKLSPQQVQAFLTAQQKTLSARTVLYTFSVLKRALGYALRWGMVPRNVAALVDAPRIKKPQLTALDPEQAKQFLAAVKGHRLEGFYTFAIATGLRRGEAIGLRWQDVDFNRCTVMVSQSIQPIHGKLVATEVKTAGSKRKIALPKTCVVALRAVLEQQQRERELAGENWQEHGLVFASAVGTPLEPKTLTRHFKRTLAAAGLPEIRIHDLRHTTASILLASGVPAQNVADLLGHSSIRVTLDVYGHIFDSSRQEVASTMDALLS